jgi:hypothetical protein
MGLDPRIGSPIHTFLLAMRLLAVVPNKTTNPTERIVGFLVFSN